MSRIDRKILDLLVCPVSKVALAPLSARELALLNQYIQSESVQTVDGHAVKTPIHAALQSIDGRVIYPILDGIMRLLPEEGIGTTQFPQWARR